MTHHTSWRMKRDICIEPPQPRRLLTARRIGTVRGEYLRVPWNAGGNHVHDPWLRDGISIRPKPDLSIRREQDENRICSEAHMPDDERPNAGKVAVRLRSTGLGQHYHAEYWPSPSFVPEFCSTCRFSCISSRCVNRVPVRKTDQSLTHEQAHEGKQVRRRRVSRITAFLVACRVN